MNRQESFLRQAVADSLLLKGTFFDAHVADLIAFYRMLQRTHKKKGKVLIFGNGGSAADAQHFAAELMHRVEHRTLGVRAHALHTDNSLLTALGNDVGFDRIFAAQIDVLAEQGDVAIAISTSGQSANIIEGLRAARRKRCRTVGLLGRNGGKARSLCDLSLVVPHKSTPRIQEVHGMIIHLVCQLLELQE
jgi:D-sedoheptulose 7-phosphate isomerase